jgi:hypothetical protein
MLMPSKSRVSRVAGLLGASTTVGIVVVVERANLQAHPALLYMSGFVGLALLGWGFPVEIISSKTVDSRKRMTILTVGYVLGSVVVLLLSIMASIGLSQTTNLGRITFVAYGAVGGLVMGLALGRLGQLVR